MCLLEASKSCEGRWIVGVWEAWQGQEACRAIYACSRM